MELLTMVYLLTQVATSGDAAQRPADGSPLAFMVVGVVAGALLGWLLAMSGARRAGLREHTSLDDFGSSYWGPYVKKAPAKHAAELGAAVGGIVGFFGGIVSYVLLTEHPWILFGCVTMGGVSGWIVARASKPRHSPLDRSDLSQLPMEEHRAIQKAAAFAEFFRKLRYSLIGAGLGLPFAYAVFLALKRAGFL